jgi:ACS family allantoate permease-like MFS transporter
MGMLQSTVNCGFVLITAKWCKYKSILSDFVKPQLTQLHSIDTKYEHAGRVGIWAASAGFSSMVGGVVAYGCSRGSAAAGLTFHGWRILSLVTGGITIFFALAMYYFLAEDITKAKFFSEEDRTLAVERLRDNHQGVGNHQFKWYQFREAFTDVRVNAQPSTFFMSY